MIKITEGLLRGANSIPLDKPTSESGINVCKYCAKSLTLLVNGWSSIRNEKKIDKQRHSLTIG